MDRTNRIFQQFCVVKSSKTRESGDELCGNKVKVQWAIPSPEQRAIPSPEQRAIAPPD